mmetsp:Transcript_91367/g.258074  ORF Transcript_91367/g.258074 Transcript_91367/m.258074 type:complete len:267 (-) Transcript_91367:501-1301(-)
MAAAAATALSSFCGARFPKTAAVAAAAASWRSSSSLLSLDELEELSFASCPTMALTAASTRGFSESDLDSEAFRNCKIFATAAAIASWPVSSSASGAFAFAFVSDGAWAVAPLVGAMAWPIQSQAATGGGGRGRGVGTGAAKFGHRTLCAAAATVRGRVGDCSGSEELELSDAEFSVHSSPTKGHPRISCNAILGGNALRGRGTSFGIFSTMETWPGCFGTDGGTGAAAFFAVPFVASVATAAGTVESPPAASCCGVSPYFLHTCS